MRTHRRIEHLLGLSVSEALELSRPNKQPNNTVQPIPQDPVQPVQPAAEQPRRRQSRCSLCNQV